MLPVVSPPYEYVHKSPESMVITLSPKIGFGTRELIVDESETDPIILNPTPCAP
jgi:hypothetical protein